MDVPELTKRELEWEAYKEWESRQTDPHILHFFHGEILLPRHVILSVFAFMGYGHSTLTTVSASQEMYFALLRSWDRLYVTHTNYNLIPTLVLYHTAEISFVARNVRKHIFGVMERQRPRIPCHRIGDAMAHNHYLVKLNLTCGAIVDSDASDVANAVPFAKKLATLIFGYNFITSVGTATIAQPLLCTSTLTTLDLSHNPFHFSGAVSISCALEWNRSLITLHLSDCCIEYAGAERIAHSLKRNHALTTLDLSRNPIFEAYKIVLALESNNTLTTLNLEGTILGCVTQYDMITAALAKKPTLKILSGGLDSFWPPMV